MARRILSNCYQNEIYTGSEKEFPLGGTTYGINYTVHTCSKCEQECCEEEYSVCDWCGAVDVELDSSGYCKPCVLEEII